MSEAREGGTATVCIYNLLTELNQQSTLPSSGLFVDGVLEFARQGCHHHTDIFKGTVQCFQVNLYFKNLPNHFNLNPSNYEENILEKDELCKFFLISSAEIRILLLRTFVMKNER